jgi:hypothetical protein
MVENNQNSVDTTQSDKNDENKAETNSSIESKTKEEKQKEAEHEPIELKESPDKKGTFTAEIK